LKEEPVEEEPAEEEPVEEEPVEEEPAEEEPAGEEPVEEEPAEEESVEEEPVEEESVEEEPAEEEPAEEEPVGEEPAEEEPAEEEPAEEEPVEEEPVEEEPVEEEPVEEEPVEEEPAGEEPAEEEPEAPAPIYEAPTEEVSETPEATQTDSPSIYSVSVDGREIREDASWTMTVVTNTATQSVDMYDDAAGSKIGCWNTWDASIEDSGSYRYWYISMSPITSAGTKEWRIYANSDSDGYGSFAPHETVFYVLPSLENVSISKYEVGEGNTAIISARTSVNARYLYIYQGDDKRTYRGSEYSTVSNGVRTWSITRTFNTAGSVTLRVAASTGNGHLTGQVSAPTILCTSPGEERVLQQGGGGRGQHRRHHGQDLLYREVPVHLPGR